MTKQEILENAVLAKDFWEGLDHWERPRAAWQALAEFVAVSDVYRSNPVRWWWSDEDGCWWQEAPWVRNGPLPMGQGNDAIYRFIERNRQRIAEEIADGGREDLAMAFTGSEFPKQMKSGSLFERTLKSALNIRNQFKG